MTDTTQVVLLAEALSAALRRHPHLGNVVTHISAKRWAQVSEALLPLLNPYNDSFSVTPLTRNLLELICDNRGTTGRIMQPFFRAFLADHVTGNEAERIEAWVWKLRSMQPDRAIDAAPFIPHDTERQIERLAS
jgi:hypothetical protein